MSWTLSIPAIPPSLNKWQRMHWRDRESLIADWDKMVFVLCREAGIGPLEKIDLDIQIHFPDRRRRDYDNLATAFKLTLDSLVKCGILPDDNPRHLARPLFPAILYDKENPRTIITIKEHPTQQRQLDLDLLGCSLFSDL